ncbi:glycosyl hydrolase [Nocardioides bruguierae]|uniref:glycosyl hydrolase n=1 Tax=Nocardioides bruguierae TaxID=2945102 RepID=UPI002020C60F|nr:glycosyl hydrolase [Nocardioides bruguierae]MCL8025950.1 glycoside hydrolase family protein [Nocardioides bruguierae]
MIRKVATGLTAALLLALPSAGTPAGAVTLPGAGTSGADVIPLRGTASAPYDVRRSPRTGTGTGTATRAAEASGRGVTVWQQRGVTRALRDSGATWFHTWTADRPSYLGRTGAAFVPMLWGAGSVTEENLRAAAEHGAWLMGFNEPDLEGQADMTVRRALRLWPRLEETGQHLVSPAVAYGGADEGGWLDRFMTGAARRDLRVDAVAVHWYGGDFGPRRATRQLREYLTAVHDRYGRPVWLTEVALMRFTADGAEVPRPKVQAAFVRRATRMLDARLWLRRYAWFSLSTPTEGGTGTGLYRPARSGVRPTTAGRAYRR